MTHIRYVSTLLGLLTLLWIGLAIEHAHKDMALASLGARCSL
jgi:hypothetical protein